MIEEKINHALKALKAISHNLPGEDYLMAKLVIRELQDAADQASYLEKSCSENMLIEYGLRICALPDKEEEES
ncbi:MAG: hypothetical protein LBJ14_05705 [Desulfarculales bacterium]|jgi:hypothetical protein|nr:hypothetical protein [Desulfarculales bacterium]